MADVPYIFANYPGGSSIPLEQLDANFASISTGQGPTGPTGPIGDLNIPIAGVDVGTSYTLQASDAGKVVCAGPGASFIVPDLTFTAGNVVSLFNHTLNPVTIYFNLPAYVTGSPFVVPTMTLAPYGFGNIWFYTPSLCIAYGSIS